MRESNGEPVLMDAVILPHRSLSPAGFVILMVCIGAVSFIAGVAFLMMGAWPVFGFFGLDVALIYLAFRMSYRSGRAREEVRVTHEEVLIRRFDPAGALIGELHLNPYWARLEAERDVEDVLTDLALVSHGKRHRLAAALGAQERDRFAAEMARALAAARA